MKDSALYKQIREFCQDGVDLIAKSLTTSGSDNPRRVVETFKVIDDYTVSQEQSMSVDWSLLVIRKEKELQALSSFQSTSKALETHTIVGPQMNTLVGTSSFMRRMDPNDLMRIVLLSVLIDKEKAELDVKLFDSLYKKIENFLFTDVFHYRYFAPISNFSTEQEVIELGENFRIIKISKEDKERLLSTSDAFHSTYSSLAFKKYAFELLIDQKKLVGESEKPIPDKQFPETTARLLFEKACSALRLYKDGLIGFNQIWAINCDWNFFGNSSHFTNKGPTEFYGSKMTLSAQEIPEFLELLKKYEDANNKNRKKVINAVTRLSFGTERVSPEDQITDYFIGLEGLFLSDNNPELKYRLALSVAHWLGSDLEDRRKIYQIISKGYDQRSSIVHGGGARSDIRIGGAVMTIADHTKLVENYLRHATKKFVVECSNQNKSEEQLLTELRDKILE